LLPPFGDALLGQYLAQPGMLVVHGFLPFSCAQPYWSLLAGSGWSWGMPPESGTRHT
jgi:hypothetical protein